MAAGSTLTTAQYHRLATLLRNESDTAYKRRVQRMLEYVELEPGQTVLDCGTGMGFYLKAVGDLFPTCGLVGVDYNPRVLAYAHGHLAPRGALLARGDIHQLAFASEAFDGVILSEVLEHLEDDAAALREVRRVMKPGAVLAISVPHARYSAWFDPFNRVAERLFRRPIRRGPFAGIWANHVRLYQPEALVRLVQDAGFVVEQVDELTHYCFPGTQFLVYTIGKGLIEHNLLPSALARSTHRFQGSENRGSPWNPINWMLALFNRIDRLNDDPQRMAGKRTFVNVTLKARKV